MAKRLFAIAAAALAFSACGSRMSGHYGGNCPFDLKFGKGDTVYMTVMGMGEVAATYRIDGDKVIVSPSNTGAGMVFTRKDDTLQTEFMLGKVVCTRLKE